MPRFFFHVIRDAERATDEEGSDLATLKEAETEAIETARELLAAEIREGVAHWSARIEVTNERGAVVFSVPFGSAVEIR